MKSILARERLRQFQIYEASQPSQEMDLVAKQAAEIKALKEKLISLSKSPEYTQEYLDEYTSGRYAWECGAYYATIKEQGADVYMVPMQRESNTKYKFRHADGSYKTYENSTYKEDLAKWNEYRDLLYKELALDPYKDYESFGTTRVDRQNPRSQYQSFASHHSAPCNPDDKYIYSFAFYAMDHVNLMKVSFGIDLKRIYTKETWEREIPADVRLGFAYIETIEHSMRNHEVEKMKRLSETDPQRYPVSQLETNIRNAENRSYSHAFQGIGAHYLHHTTSKWIDHLLERAVAKK